MPWQDLFLNKKFFKKKEEGRIDCRCNFFLIRFCCIRITGICSHWPEPWPLLFAGEPLLLSSSFSLSKGAGSSKFQPSKCFISWDFFLEFSHFYWPPPSSTTLASRPLFLLLLSPSSSLSSFLLIYIIFWFPSFFPLFYKSFIYLISIHSCLLISSPVHALNIVIVNRSNPSLDVNQINYLSLSTSISFNGHRSSLNF